MRGNLITAKEAKRLENIEMNLIEKFKNADKVELPEHKNIIPAIQSRSDTFDLMSTKHSEPLTVSQARRLEKIKQKLQADFANVYTQELQEIRENEKKYEPITRAIREQNDIVKDYELKKQNRLKQIAKFRPRAASTPAIDRQREIEFENIDEEVFDGPNQSLKQLVDTKQITLGIIGTRYLPRANDTKFGIWYDETIEKLKVGSEVITFDHDDIILVQSNKRYKGSEGLWKLLTKNDNLVRGSDYTDDDWESYKDILIRTNSLYQRNDPKTGRPKSSGGKKWKTMIKPVWEENVKTVSSVVDNEIVQGSGLKVYTEQPVEYRYIKTLNELINRLNYIHAQEEAGNNNFHNEKLSVVKFLYDRLEELVRTPKGVKYLVRCLSALPEHTIEGSGLLNEIINKLPFELHAPRNWNLDPYNYCGPGTKLNARLARGDKGVNPLDEACKEHDIWYRDHKNTEDRWEGDKILQNRAWERVTSADADLNERAVGLATTGAMWLKRKMGMGLGTSSYIYRDNN